MWRFQDFKGLCQHWWFSTLSTFWFFKIQHLAISIQNMTTLSTCASLYPRNLETWDLEKCVAMQVLISWNLETLKSWQCWNVEPNCIWILTRKQHFQISIFQKVKISTSSTFQNFENSRFQPWRNQTYCTLFWGGDPPCLDPPCPKGRGWCSSGAGPTSRVGDAVFKGPLSKSPCFWLASRWLGC